jgi:hypothetical protein
MSKKDMKGCISTIIGMTMGGKRYTEAGGCKTHAQKLPEFFSRGQSLF